MNCALLSGVLPGSSRFSPLSVLIDQLLCLPLPFTPANGFSCKRHTSPCRRATFFITSIVSWFWSEERFVVEKIGAISCCAGATSLCSVFDKMPYFHSVSLRSSIYSTILGLRAAKYWSSISCPFAGFAPKSVRPVKRKSFRCSHNLRSTMKYSCSGPTVVATCFTSVLPNSFKMRNACSFNASIERKSGVFLSRASPVYEQNAVGIQSVCSFTNGYAVGSHTV